MSLQLDFTRPRDEDEQVRRWEFGQLLELGVDPVSAALAAAAGVRWHDVERLVAAGCTPDLALEIAT